MPITTYEDTLRLLHVIAEHDVTDNLWWRTDDRYAPATFFINCNDLFAWACSDCEEVTAADIDDLDQAYKDADAAEKIFHGGLLWVCRKRKMRPQGAFYKYFNEKESALFDACGEPRKTDFANPVERV